MNRFISKIHYWQMLWILLIFNFITCHGTSLNKNKIDLRTQDVSWAGTYSYGTTAKAGAVGFLKIYPIDESNRYYIFHLEINRGYPSYNSGEIFGKIEITPEGGGIFKVKNDQVGMNCMLTFDFQENTVIIKTGARACNCGFGNAVIADGEYKRTNPEIPNFFIDRHGDTIYFKNLVHEF